MPENDVAWVKDAVVRDLSDDARDGDAVDATARIVAVYVLFNWVAPDDLAGLISSVGAAIGALKNDGSSRFSRVEKAPLVPAVPIEKSVTDDFMVCLEDGRKFKSLKRHLAGRYGLTPDQYRARWGLPSDYPMVAPAYTKRRSEIAKQSGLGRQNRVLQI